MEILRNSNTNKLSRDEEIKLGVSIDSTQKVIPRTGLLSSVLSLYELYNEERDNCDRFRLIFTVNPICTNVLYNIKTEIVKGEGSDDCVCLNYENIPWTGLSEEVNNVINTSGDSLTFEQAMLDTEYSYKDLGGLVYHCGVDIFDNHMLRNTGFQFFKKPSGNTGTITDDKAREVFNTINSYLTDNDGKVVKEKMSLTNETTEVEMHAYYMDNIMSFQDSFLENLREIDGWYGFYNAGNINIPNTEIDGKEVNLNRTINNNKQCEFIDLYPDRSLFSFIPKVNKARRRVENNWDYCITYPAESDSGMLVTCGVANSDGSIRMTKIESGRTDGGNYLIRFTTIIDHGLSVGDYIGLRTNVNDDIIRCQVTSLGDLEGHNTDRVFTIRYNNIARLDILHENEADSSVTIDTSWSASFKRISNGVECKYYFRVLKKLGDYRSECNKIVGGKNIYGDKFAQIVFTDDIVLPFDVKDNLGMPVSELYLTVVKRNAGNRLWYDYPSDASGSTLGSPSIEFSHCFGKVTAALDLSDTVGDYNIHRIHNCEGVDIFGTESGIVQSIGSEGDGITVYDDTFYLDIVEFDQTTFAEKSLEPVYFRFNTRQREFNPTDTGVTNVFSSITYHELMSDDYTPNGSNGFSDFEVSALTIPDTSNTGETPTPVNLMPEGYYYKPSFRVKVRERSDFKTSPMKLMRGDVEIREDAEWGMVFECGTDLGLKFGDVICFVNADSTAMGQFKRFVRTEDSNFIVVDIDPSMAGPYSYVYRVVDRCPLYSVVNPKTSELVWREIVPMSELDNDSDLYDMPFSNGANYRHTNINFFLRRQDPDGNYGLRDYNNEAADYSVQWLKRMDLSEVFFFYNNLSQICF